MIDKIVVFAAGRGTRMKELTSDKPKQLIEINGRPFFYYLLRNIQAAGFLEVIVIIGYLAEQFEDFAMVYQKEIPPVKFINQFTLIDEQKYGSLIPLMVAREAVGANNFVAINGDDFYKVEILKKFRELDDDFCYIGATSVIEPEKFGALIKDEHDYLLGIEEKSPRPKSDIINTGIYKFTPQVYSVARQVPRSPRGEYEITDAIMLLAKQRKVKVIVGKDYWQPFGYPEHIPKLKRLLSN